MHTDFLSALPRQRRARGREERLLLREQLLVRQPLHRLLALALALALVLRALLLFIPSSHCCETLGFSFLLWKAGVRRGGGDADELVPVAGALQSLWALVTFCSAACC